MLKKNLLALGIIAAMGLAMSGAYAQGFDHREGHHAGHHQH